MANHKNNSNGLVTAYESNSRAGSTDEKLILTDWHHKINELLSKGYSFLPLIYDEGGILFRGMQSSILQSLLSDHFINFSSSNPHSALEKELDIYFVSHELSDALTVARIWEESNDSGLICFSTSYFREEHENKNAAVMAFSEPGFVFNYPFLTQGLKTENLLAIYLNPTTYNHLNEQLDKELFAKIGTLLTVIDDEVISLGRTAVENKIKEDLNNKTYNSAKLIEAIDYPKK